MLCFFGSCFFCTVLGCFALFSSMVTVYFWIWLCLLACLSGVFARSCLRWGYRGVFTFVCLRAVDDTMFFDSCCVLVVFGAEVLLWGVLLGWRGVSVLVWGRWGCIRGVL